MLAHDTLLSEGALDLAAMAALLGEGHERPNLLDSDPSRADAIRPGRAARRAADTPPTDTKRR